MFNVNIIAMNNDNFKFVCFNAKKITLNYENTYIRKLSFHNKM